MIWGSDSKLYSHTVIQNQEFHSDILPKHKKYLGHKKRHFPFLLTEDIKSALPLLYSIVVAYSAIAV